MGGMMSSAPARYPGRAPIEAYGNGGFRFAGMSHKGSLMCLPSGVYAWPVSQPAEVTRDTLAPALAEAGALEVLLLGTGLEQVFPSHELRKTFEAAGIGLEAMDTGAAARTYNVLLAEGRSVGAALLAVDRAARVA